MKAMIALAFTVMLGLFVWKAKDLNKDVLWYSHVDHDSTLLIESLRSNAGQSVGFAQHPAVALYPWLGAELKLGELFGLIPVSSNDQLLTSEDPLTELPALFLFARDLAISHAVLLGLLLGLIVYLLSSSKKWAALSSCVYFASAGPLFQALFIRTEMWSCLYYALSLLVAIWALKQSKKAGQIVGLFLGGVFFALALFSKLIVMPLLAPTAALIFWLALKNPLPSLSKDIWAKALWLLSGLVAFFYFFFKMKNSYFQLPLPWFGILFCVSLSLPALVLTFFQHRWASALQRPSLYFLGVLTGSTLVFELFPHDFPQREYIFEQLFGLRHFSDKAMTVSLNQESKTSFFLDVFVGEFLYRHFLVLFHLSFVGMCFVFFRSTNLLISGLFLASGLGLSLLNSLRYFGDHYLLYSELFYVLAIGTYLASSKPRWQTLNAKRLQIVMVVALLPFLAWSNYRYVSTNYFAYNIGYRDLIEKVHTGVMAHHEYEKQMLAHYGSKEEIYHRLLCDPKLNGEEQSIDWRTKGPPKKTAEKILGERPCP